MDRYTCYKEVEAFKINRIYEIGETEGNPDNVALVAGEMEVLVSEAYMNKHKPQVSGYYVKYPDGYESWSPAEAFEGGYTLIVEDSNGH